MEFYLLFGHENQKNKRPISAQRARVKNHPLNPKKLTENPAKTLLKDVPIPWKSIITFKEKLK